MEMCSDGNQHPWTTKQFLISLFTKYQSFTVGGMLMVEIFSIAKPFPLTKLFYLEEISIAESFLIMNLSAVEDKMT